MNAFQKGRKSARFLCNLMDKVMENLNDHGCPKVGDLAETDDELWICSSYQFRHKTTFQFAERKAIFC